MRLQWQYIANFANYIGNIWAIYLHNADIDIADIDTAEIYLLAIHRSSQIQTRA